MKGTQQQTLHRGVEGQILRKEKKKKHTWDKKSSDLSNTVQSRLRTKCQAGDASRKRKINKTGKQDERVSRTGKRKTDIVTTTAVHQ